MLVISGFQYSKKNLLTGTRRSYLYPSVFARRVG